MDLSGRKVLITGANRGVGAAFVGAALSRQAATVVAAARDTVSLPRSRIRPASCRPGSTSPTGPRSPR
jgi:NAD(P)-dependent dehydrogenase (short-subunit alcohol dehydrogenase family)